MISLLLAAALHAAPVVLTQSPSSVSAPRYVRLSMNVDGYGIKGTGSLLIDRQSGRYVEHLNIGPLSGYQGFDGVHAWQADVTGMTAIQGNSIDRGTVLAWGYLFASPRSAQVHGSSVRYDGVPQLVSITVDPQTHLVRRFSMFSGSVREVAVFSNYRPLTRGLIGPGSIAFTDDNGTWKGRISGAATGSSASDRDFAMPPRPHDSTVTGGLTSVPFLVATEILIPVRINNGPVMHFILDTGGQNVLTSDSAKRLGLHTVGAGTVGGAGAGVIPTRFVTVRSVRVGSAEMRDQPFLVLNTQVLGGIDGIVGFELLSRFAARVDYRTNTLWLASSVPSAWTGGVPATPFAFRSHQPQISGAIDGIPGALTIDTGNSGVLDINSPFAHEHNLWSVYHAKKPKTGALVGVGGSVPYSNITVRSLRLGSVTLENVHADLTQATAGIEANPSIAANAGEGVFRNFSFVLDYPNQRLYFAPGGVTDMSGVLFSRSGNRIVVQRVRTGRAHRAGIRAGMVLTSMNGRPVRGSDLAAVQAQLQARQPGTKVRMVFDGSKPVTLMLLNYL